MLNRETLSACLEQYFGQIPDPRVERTRAHQLLDIIAIALFAVLAGADSWVAIETMAMLSGLGWKRFCRCPMAQLTAKR